MLKMPLLCAAPLIASVAAGAGTPESTIPNFASATFGGQPTTFLDFRPIEGKVAPIGPDPTYSPGGSEGGEVKINIPHRVYQVYGRQLSITGAGGSRSTVALFDFNGCLYQVEGKTLPGGNPLDMLRFQQSLVFTGGGSNRSADAIRAIREGCGAGVANPAGLDDPRCARR
jgi:hypothetical protein